MLIGLLSGLAVVCFRISIETTRIWLLGSGLAPASWERTLFVPLVAGIVVALLVMWAFPDVRGSGVNQTKAAVYIYDGYVPFRTVIGKFITCALSIGCGFSLGPEDPSLQMGAGIASVMGRRLRLSQEKTRLLAPVGAAAGLAAAFNAPIAGVMFVFEEVIGTWSAGGLGGLILAAASSVTILRLFLGSQPIFRVPPYRGFSAPELIGYAVLGVFGGFASLVFLKFLAYVRPKLRKLPRWTFYVQPAIAGLLIGAIGLAYPQVMGAGYVYIDQGLHGQFTWQTLGILSGLKILATGMAFVSGTPGGMFAPAMFIGATLGGAVGGAEHIVFPHLHGSVSAFALVGIGTLFAGFLRTPITSVFMVLETSGNYSIIIPVMISNTIAYLISRRYQKVPLFDLLSRQEGVDLPSLEEQREQPVLRVEHAMNPPAFPVVRSESLVGEAIAMATSANAHVLLVRFPSGRWMAVERSQLDRYGEADGRGRKLSDVLTADWLPTVHPDQPLDAAIGFVQGRAVVPVVSRVDPGKLEGVLTLDDVLETYKEASNDSRGSSHSVP
ncbi:MAG: chloride channel protein [Acidobacteriota bacterium]|nr:chloride channel protein [Acidobacteriota bacterium]